ncbi:MAG: N-sulfoglucosamine sulfohydrolase [Verrucomicrobiales bacterium]|jgi:N-sulfoglucosamine sulfohydrolase
MSIMFIHGSISMLSESVDQELVEKSGDNSTLAVDARFVCKVRGEVGIGGEKALSGRPPLLDDTFMKETLWLLIALFFTSFGHAAPERPNILFCIADDWGWPHAGAYQNDEVVKTPAFDRIAREGVLFHHAYISSPSCTPSRNAILTGQWHWRLGPGANLWSTLDEDLKVYPHLLRDAGYQIGSWRKSWGPGRLEGRWKGDHPAGKVHKKGFAEFIAQREEGKPFCFWLGASDPHRGYKLNSGRDSGMDLSKIKLFEHYPDSEMVRGDVADYYFEVQRFDSDVARAIKLLEEKGELDNTIIVVTGDHGMPFPRCKSNVYDSGARVPLAIRWGAKVKAGQVSEGFVSTTDLAPTFLQAAGVDVPEAMTGQSLLPALTGGGDEKLRDHILFGKERHVPGQEGSQGGYPIRALRTKDFLYIRNYEPERWPNGTPNWQKAARTGAWLADCDNGPTKTYIVENRDKDEAHRLAYDLCFGKRPAEELFDLKSDAAQLVNVAGEAEFAEVKKELAAQLTAELTASGDPRHDSSEAFDFDAVPYLGGVPSHPDARKQKGKKAAKR